MIPKVEKRASGLWKFPTPLLSDEQYTESIREVIKNTIDLNQALNPQALWELIKYKISFETTKYSKIKAKELKKFRSDLNTRITH